MNAKVNAQLNVFSNASAPNAKQLINVNLNLTQNVKKATNNVVNNVKTNAPLTTVPALKNAVNNMKNVTTNLKNVSNELQNTKKLKPPEILGQDSLIPPVVLKNVPNVIKNANNAIKNLNVADKELKNAKKLNKTLLKNANIMGFNKTNKYATVNSAKNGLRTKDNQIKNTAKIIAESKGILSNSMKKLKQLYTAEGKIVNVKYNNNGAYVNIYKNKRRLTHMNTRGVLPIVSKKETINRKHYNSQGKLSQVYKTKNNLPFTIKTGTQGNTMHYPFGISKLINAGETMI